MEFKRLSFKHKPSRFFYYVRNYLRLLVPQNLQFKNIDDLKSRFSAEEMIALQNRVDYYNKLESKILVPNQAVPLADFNLAGNIKTYFFDLKKYTNYFNQKLKINYLFGDVTTIPSEASIVKSRPIAPSNENAILLNLNKIRHFIFIEKDDIPFRKKQSKLIGRNKVHPPQQHRIKFLAKYANHPLCDIGMVNKNELNPNWFKNRMTITEQLNYKFILCLEGNDVASNLKWVMSSNSIAVMPKPKYETWFMEGQLIPDHHYLCIKDDYSNLEEKMKHLLSHPEEALNIISNAHKWIDRFKNQRKEDLISVMTLQKYFLKTGQI